MKTGAIRFCIQAQHGKEDYDEARKELNALLARLAELEAAQLSYQVVSLNCGHSAELEESLNEFSDAGWRVVAVLGDLDHTQHVVLEGKPVAPVSQPHITNWEVVPEISADDYSENAPMRYFLRVQLSDGRDAKIVIGPYDAERIAQTEYVGGIIAPIVNRHFGCTISSEDW